MEEDDDIDETQHLMRSPKNAARLLASIAAANAGDIVPHDLIDPKSDDQIKLGSVLAKIGTQIRLTAEEFALFEQIRDKE